MSASADRCEISTDRSKFEVKAIHAFLSTSYWSRGIPLATLERALENSICFGAFDGAKQHPDVQGLRRMVLVTRDAHGLYGRFGFSPLAAPERWMELHDANVYEAR